MPTLTVFQLYCGWRTSCEYIILRHEEMEGLL